MLDFFENGVLVAVVVAGALVFMAALNLIWPPEKRRNHNDLIGWQLSILGTTYAVILGFMLYTVWTNFGTADLNVDQEAGALGNFYMLAGALPEPQRTQLRTLARSYADAAIHSDWPLMQQGKSPEQTLNVNEQMWTALMTVRTQSSTEATAHDHALSQLSALSECRRMRLLQSRSHLPAVLWCVLVAGAVLTIVSCCMFGSESSRLHALQVFAFSFLIALALAAIADINQPFRGAVHVSDLAFLRAQHMMQTR
jgi:Protein of unknown function (DUF4239)